jgi:DNA-binding FadR family transcriptional regulator
MNTMADRVREFRKRFAARRSKAGAADTHRALTDARRPPDVSSVRAKSRRHGKVAADRWNQ